ncbi:MAG: Txe/YoeB family addiction module toxin [Limosilactobacillus sp.]|nr:Txe/YoeB family addiction module toxin [Limosilactobacillus sp.]
MNKAWTNDGWDDYLTWYDEGNKAMIKKINRLIKDIDRHPYEGIGKPEPLKYGYAGLWSRRITIEHRLVYEIIDDTIWLYSCRYHY